MTLAERLRKARELFGVSQNEMAKRLGISKPAWQGYELGKNEPGSSVIEGLVKLGFDANWLLTGEGLMRKADPKTFNIPLLAVIIEALEEHEVGLGEKMTPEKKAHFISTACNMFIDDEVVTPGIKDRILNSMKAVYDLLNTLDLMIKTEKGRERARKLLTSEFKRAFPKDYAKWEAEEFIDSRILKAHKEEGTLKFSAEVEGRTIQSTDRKDSKVKKDAKNRN